MEEEKKKEGPGRECTNGSWHIQDPCKALQRFRKVSKPSIENSRKSIGKKQIACFATMHTKKLYFRP
ncbi:unnamed protein product [Boreogadus saida]